MSLADLNVLEVFRKDEVAKKDYTFDWSDFLGESDVIVESTWEYDDGITILNTTRSAQQATAWIEGGTRRTFYRLANTIRTLGGRTDRRCVLVAVYGRSNLTQWLGSPAVFAKAAAAAASSAVMNLLKEGLLETEVQAAAHAASGAQAAMAVIRVTGKMVASAQLQAVIIPRTQGLGAIVARATMAAQVFDPVDPPEPPDPSGTPVLWMGVALDSTTLRTIYTPGVTAVVANDAELSSAMTAGKAGTVDEIWLNPGQTYNYPTNKLSSAPPLDRTAANPLRIMRNPNLGGSMPRLQGIFEDRQVTVSGQPFAWGGVAFHGLDTANSTFLMWQGAHDIMFEDCLCHGNWQGGFIQGQVNEPRVDATKQCLNLVNRFCRVLDGHSTSGAHAQGHFMRGVEFHAFATLFDHNGWTGNDRDLADLSGGPTIFNHDLYLSKPGGPNGGHLQKCIFANASSHGVHLRPGGILEDCLFLKNPMNQCGYSFDGLDFYGTSGGAIRRCIWIDACDQDSQNQRGSWLWLQQVKDLLIEDNIVTLNSASGALTMLPNPPGPKNRYGLLFRTGPAPVNVTVRRNIMYQFCPPQRCLTAEGTQSLAGVTATSNHFEDGSAYANPGVALNYREHLIIPGLRANGISIPAYDTMMAAIRAGFVIP